MTTRKKKPVEEAPQVELPLEPGWTLLDPRTTQVTIEGKTYPCDNGIVHCPAEVARKMAAAGLIGGAA